MVQGIEGVGSMKVAVVLTRSVAVLALVLVAWSAQAGPQDRLLLQPLTEIGPDGSGYLSDPQPIRLASGVRDRMQYLSGTTKAIVACAYPLQPRCFSWTPIGVDALGLLSDMQAAGVSVTNIQNINIFQADGGAWHAAVTIGVHSPEHPDYWTVIAHAGPVGAGKPGEPPLAWRADTLLVGSFHAPADGNYDAKYYEEDGRLYLLYVRNVAPKPGLRNVIVLQPLRSFTAVASEATELLGLGDRYGELNSEWYADTKSKLVEAPWLARIGGKHALIYSTGAYLTPGYKAGVAWSDTLMPPPGGRYRKVLHPDPENIWHSAAGRDVHYLLQSEKPRWPNFTGGAVTGPGVAAAVRGPAGAWWLFFNGFAPGDMPHRPDGRVDGTHRRPFGVLLRAAVPSNRSVAEASDAEIATWLEPQRDQ